MVLTEIRWHGRGGQGVWTASNLLADAAISEGKYAQSFPAFGPERMGAPITAFTRISDEPIELHCEIYEPDVVVVLDPTLLSYIDVLGGLKLGGKVVLNFKGRNYEELTKILGSRLSNYRVYTVPATDIAVKVLGRGVTNTAMLGALIKVTPIVNLETLYNIIMKRFRESVARRNIEVIRIAYRETEEVARDERA